MKEYFIVRCDRAGVFAGNIKFRSGREVAMTDVRRLHTWSGAASLSQMARDGVNQPNDCRFTIPLDEIFLLDAIEIIPCTKAAEKIIKGVKEWKV